MKVVAKPITMIAVFDQRGVPKPIKFKVEEDGGSYIVKVDKIIKTEQIRPAGMDALVFLCQSAINDILKQYEIVYRIKQHLWELYKI